jgi:hypothetical protein
LGLDESAGGGTLEVELQEFLRRVEKDGGALHDRDVYGLEVRGHQSIHPINSRNERILILFKMLYKRIKDTQQFPLFMPLKSFNHKSLIIGEKEKAT